MGMYHLLLVPLYSVAQNLIDQTKHSLRAKSLAIPVKQSRILTKTET